MSASDYPGNEWAAWAPYAGTRRGGIDSIQYLILYILFLYPERSFTPCMRVLRVQEKERMGAKR